MAATCERCGQVHTAGPWCENAQALHAAAVEANFGPGGVPTVPPAPVVLNGPSAPDTLLASGASAKHTPVPYLGPDPMPSRRYGVAVQILTAVAAVTAAAQAIVLYGRMRLAERVAGGDVVVAATWSSKDALLGGLGALRLLFVVAAIVAGVLWRRSRRPNDLLVHYGEAYVELPLTWIVPVWLRFAPAVLFSAGFLAGATAQPDDPLFRTFAEQAAMDRAACFGAVCWAIAWASLACWPVISERTHVLRRAWSEWYRERPGSVPYVAPVADRPNDVGRPAGIGWVLRTAGLVLLLIVGVIGTLSAASALFSDTGPAVLVLAVLVPVDVLVVQAFVRRRRRAAAAASATAPTSIAAPEAPAPEPAGTVTWF